MKRRVVVGLSFLFVVALYAVPVFAQEPGAAGAQGEKSMWLLITSGFAMAVAAAGCGYAQSRALTAACEGVSRNPGATDTIRIFTFLGLAFIEFLALLTFVVIMLLLYV
jgi:F-type H+-transporting ATPase subunit c